MGIFFDCGLAWIGGHITYMDVCKASSIYGIKKEQYACVENYPRMGLWRVAVRADSDIDCPYSYYGYNTANFWFFSKDKAIEKAEDLNKSIC